MIMQENILLGLSPLPDLSTVSGFIHYHIIRFKQQCAGIVIESEGINVDVDAHQYGRVTSILNGLFNTGCTLQGYNENFSQATEDLVAIYSSCYVGYFTKKNLIEYFKTELNRPKNYRLRARIIFGETKYRKMINQFSWTIRRHGEIICNDKAYKDIDDCFKDEYYSCTFDAEYVESLLRKENILV